MLSVLCYLSPATYFSPTIVYRDYFEQKPLYVGRNNDHYADWLSTAQIDAMLRKVCRHLLPLFCQCEWCGHSGGRVTITETLQYPNTLKPMSPHSKGCKRGESTNLDFDGHNHSDVSSPLLLASNHDDCNGGSRQ